MLFSPKKILFAGILFMLSFLTTHAQDFYVVANGLERVTLKGSTISYQSISGCSGYGTIAIYGDKFYTFSGNELVESTISGNSLINCKTLCFVDGYPLGATVDENGVLYFAADYGLYKVDPNTAVPTPVKIGTMPYAVAGDFVFSNKILYMASAGGIVKVDIAHPELSTMAIPIPAATIYGMCSLLDPSGKIKVYALELDFSGTLMLELDLEKNVVAKVAYTLEGRSVGDAASNVESGRLPELTITNVDVRERCDKPGAAQVTISASGGEGPITYSLNGVASTDGLYPDVAPGTYTIKVSTAKTTVTQSVDVPDYSINRPAVTYDVVNAKCEIAGSISFHIAADDAQFKISYNGTVTPFTKPFTGLLPGIYHFTVLRQNGCLFGDFDVEVKRDKCPIIITDATILQECDAVIKGSVTVNTPPHAYPYVYTLNSESNANGVFHNISPGSYQIKVTSSEDEVFVPVTVPDYKLDVPNYTATQESEVCDLGGTITFDNLGNTKLYQLRFQNGLYPFNHTFKGLHTGGYSFTILDQKGCIVDTARVQVLQEPCLPVAFPNTFTPNGDGINDIFRPNQDGRAFNYQLHIFNRNGGEVFRSTDLHQGWGGDMKGANAPAGVYYWIATFISQEKKSIVQRGWVTLIR